MRPSSDRKAPHTMSELVALALVAVGVALAVAGVALVVSAGVALIVAGVALSAVGLLATLEKPTAKRRPGR